MCAYLLKSPAIAGTPGKGRKLESLSHLHLISRWNNSFREHRLRSLSGADLRAVWRKFASPLRLASLCSKGNAAICRHYSERS